VQRAGGRKKLSRALNISHPIKWTRCPQARVFEVAALTGMDPRALRPDLAAWLDAEEARMKAAAGAAPLSLSAFASAVEHRWSGLTMDEGLIDLWATLAAVMFVARERGLKPQQIYTGRGAGAESARSYAMALAKVVGRARSTNIAGVFGVTRQNVDNASERYLRSRDGDDPDDFIQGYAEPRVLEIGSNRLRRAKEADPALWEAQQRFDTFLHGERYVQSPSQTNP
jgi:hypothetical protein